MSNMDKKINSENLPSAVLVGRVNVGKSTIFNRLIEENKALVSEIPGTTRTNNEGIILWRGKQVKLVDTGGLTFTDNVSLEKEILKQSEKAMKSADIVIFVADAQAGVMPQEKELAKRIRRIGSKPVLFVANKVDSEKIEYNLTEPEWQKLGLGEPVPISAANGRQIGDFLDLLFTTAQKSKRRPKSVKKEDEEKIINVSIIGKPNVGKSSLFNKIIGEEKVIVNPMPHTTREPFDTLLSYNYELGGENKKFLFNFIDTAGIRRKSNVEGQLEKEGIQKSIRIAGDSEIVLFILDASEPISMQDCQLGGLLEKKCRSVIIILNKWDLAEDTSDKFRNNAKRMVYSYFPHLDFAPIIFTSGLTGYRVHDIFPMLVKIWQARQTVIPDNQLENFIKKTVREHLPSRGRGVRHPVLLGMKQVESNPPVFTLFIKARTSLHYSYVSFVKRRLREQFNFLGTPVIIKLSKMKK